MAGEVWRSSAAIALQPSTTPVQPATRRLYWVDPHIKPMRDPTVHRAASGRRDNVFAVTSGPIKADGSLSMPMSAEESLEVLSMGISGTPVITTPATGVLTRLHTYKPGDLAAGTIEWFDGKRGWIGAGYRVNTLTIAGNVTGDNTLSADLFGADCVPGTVTGGLPERDPTFIEGWKTRLFVEAFTGTPGTTEMPGTLINWNVQVSNNLDRRYTAGNTQAANRVIAGELDVTASMVFDSDSAFSIAEFTNWLNGVSRMVRLEFQDESAFIETISVAPGPELTSARLMGESARTPSTCRASTSRQWPR
jgi:hypothetical protein